MHFLLQLTTIEHLLKDELDKKVTVSAKMKNKENTLQCDLGQEIS